jgi:electron transport complex protein RnfG
MEEQKIYTDIPIISSEEPSSLQMILTLGAAGFLSGLILVCAYVFTLPVIERNKEEALQEAIYRVLPACKKYDAMILVNGELAKQENQSDRSVPRIFLGYNEKGSVIGFAIPANEPGFADMLSIIYGFDGVGKIIIGYEVLDSKETPGLGDKIFKDKHFVSNFTALAVDPSIQAVKMGAKTKPNQVETITGATISSKAIIRALQSSLQVWRSAMDAYVKNNQLTYSAKP